MKDILKNYLFAKHILVSESEEKQPDSFEAVFLLANMFNIKITDGRELAGLPLIFYVSSQVAITVPEPFYRNFPQSVRELSPDQLLFDQLLHYVKTYGFNDFSEPGHSVFERDFPKIAYKGSGVAKEFKIISEKAAEDLLSVSVCDLLKGTRPLSNDLYEVCREFIVSYGYKAELCSCKDTAIRLLCDTRDLSFTRFLSLSDVIKVVARIQYFNYYSLNISKLNLCNKDRKFITSLINEFFAYGECNIKECFEKKAKWCGLLHHLHYKATSKQAVDFVTAIRSKGNISVYSEFERAIYDGQIENAVKVLRTGKGSGALLRNLDYILSRCKNEDDVRAVVEKIYTKNPIILIQLFFSYSAQKNNEARTFKFFRFNKMCIHVESEDEFERRRALLNNTLREQLATKIYDNLRGIYHNTLGSVYVDENMKNIALPISEAASSGGLGVLAKGSRIHIGRGKIIRAFTYWEKVNDIDLAAIGLADNGKQTEFSWRTMSFGQRKAITFSGDQTAGYKGGSEFFDINVTQFRKLYPKIHYLIFCDNVYSCSDFSSCYCKAGYMIRKTKDGGEAYEPKSVASSFMINAKSSFAYLFAIDFEKRDFIWINVAREDEVRVAGTTSIDLVVPYLNCTSLFNLYDLFSMMATKLTEDPKEAEVVVSDSVKKVDSKTRLIRSFDFDAINALINNPNSK